LLSHFHVNFSYLHLLSFPTRRSSDLLVILFVLLISRIIFLAERQKTTFARVYGYSVAGILFIHFAVNIGMVVGILPTVGIPLPLDRKSTRLNSSHVSISYVVFCLTKK